MREFPAPLAIEHIKYPPHNLNLHTFAIYNVSEVSAAATSESQGYLRSKSYL